MINGDDDFDMDGPDEGALDWSCSIIREARDTVTHGITFRDALSGIRTGRWAAQVESVRLAYAQGGKDAAAKPKKLLPGLLFSGTFSRRAAEAVTAPSGLICADLDGLGDTVGTWFEQITADPHTLACFRSPSGAGLKVVMRIDPSRPHIESYHALEHYMLEHFGLQVDEKCSDVSRICFVSHDPELFEAPDATPLPYPPAQAKPVKEFHLPPRTNGVLSPGDDFILRGGPTIPDLLTAHGWTHLRGKYWCRPGKSGDTSASWEHYPNTLHVFSSAPETGLPPDQKGFDPFAVYTHLEHGGDWKAATRELAKKGYGTPSRQQQNLDRIAGPAVEPPEDEIESRRITLASNPTEPTTRLFLANKPVATPGNLVSIISKAKTGKTAAIGGVVAAIIGAHYDRQGLDCLGFTAPHTKEAVVLIDTEQSPFDAFTCHKRAFARAAQDVDVPWLCHYAMVGYDAAALRATLPKILARAKTNHQAVFTVILDGVADFVASVNDEAECNGFIAWLRSLAVTYDCPIICVIHSNEAVKAGDDGRGHLGKQLTRKSESNLLLKKTGEVTVITSEKQRKAPITEADGIAFEWSNEQGRHVSCAKAATEKTGPGRPPLYDQSAMLSCFPGPREQGISLGQIHRAIGQLPCGISDRAFKDWVAKWVANGEVIRSGDRKVGFGFRRAAE